MVSNSDFWTQICVTSNLIEFRFYFNKSNLCMCPETGPSPFSEISTQSSTLLWLTMSPVYLASGIQRKEVSLSYSRPSCLARYLSSVIFLSLSYSRPSWLDSAFLIYPPSHPLATYLYHFSCCVQILGFPGLPSQEVAVCILSFG